MALKQFQAAEAYQRDRKKMQYISYFKYCFCILAKYLYVTQTQAVVYIQSNI